MIGKFKKLSTPKKAVLISTIVVIAVVLVVAIGKLTKIVGTPCIELASPEPIENSNRDEIVVDVILTSLPKNIYPGASISVGFDKNKLEFTGVKQGTMMTLGEGTTDNNKFNIPVWDCNVDKSNTDGLINAMYLDMTAGKYSYCEDGYDKKNKNIVLRLGFKLRDSVIPGEVYNLKFHDAIFATINDSKDNSSLSTVKGTLRGKSGKIVVLK